VKDHLIIVAAGVGTRMKADLPKQFLQLAGKPVLLHTLEKSHRFNPKIHIVVVVHPEYVSFWHDLVLKLGVSIPHTVVEGGSSRFDSVKMGLEAIHEQEGIVGIHDAVRPLVSLKTLERCFDVARTRGNAIPSIEVPDTVRNAEGEWMDRNQLRLIQTPQCFEISLLREAYQQSYRSNFTDDASVVQAMGEKLHFVEGNRENLKITTMADLRMAEALMSL